MINWVLSIVGVVFLGVLVEIVMPDGKINSFIKHLFGVFILYVLFEPITGIVQKINFTNNVDNVVDLNYVSSANSNKLDEIENMIIVEMEQRGVLGVGVVANGNIFSEEFKVDIIYVDLTNATFNIDSSQIANLICEVVFKITGLKKENIVIYGV